MTQPSERLTASLADRYRIERELGAGGMATVYLAQDLKHDRKVAIKVLRPELAAVIGAERFLREIKTIANLQHPHILGLIDSGEVNGTAYYVMPFVEGESLRDRLNREKQLPIADAVRLAGEVAAALDYAHRRGVIHRDIKPENVMLHDGSALVADFGIALAVSSAGGSRMTETGMSLGTPHYMSPEQAMGEREISARSDVYALGAMTYEMLIGDPPFTGSTAQAIIAKVMTSEPVGLITQRKSVPPAVEDAVLTALEKLPADRFASAAEFAAGLGGRISGTGRTGTRQAGKAAVSHGATRRSMVTGFLLGAMITLTGAALYSWMRSAPAQPPLLLSVALAQGEGIAPVDGGTRIALSPDGTMLAYVGPGEVGGRVWLRRLNQLHATPIQGSDGGHSPFFSPDGTRLGFFFGTTLRILSLESGTVTVLADTGVSIAGGAWSDDDWIYFDANAGIARINVRTRVREMVYQLDSTGGELGLAWPQLLPNGKVLIFRVRRDVVAANFDIVAMKLPGGTPRVVARAVYARYHPSGNLLYVTADGTLLTAPFDADKLALGGTGTVVAEGLSIGTFGVADLTNSANGGLAYIAGPPLQSSITSQVPLWVDRAGNGTPTDTAWRLTAPANSMALSPDGRSLALSLRRPNGIGSDIWIRRLDTGTLSRLTFERTWNGRPVWLPDGRSVAYVSGDAILNIGEIRAKRADGSERDELLASGSSQLSAIAFSRDGRWQLVRSPTSSPAGANIGMMRRDIPDSIHWILDSRFTETTPALSPDGRWLAYASNETGVLEIYLRPFPDVSTAKWQVSSGGGSAPLWSHSGSRLFFMGGGALNEVEFRPGAQFSTSSQRRLFPIGRFKVDESHWFYGVAPGDGRFIMYGSDTEQEGIQLILGQQWTPTPGQP